jgi:hypothetical protein
MEHAAGRVVRGEARSRRRAAARVLTALSLVAPLGAVAAERAAAASEAPPLPYESPAQAEARVRAQLAAQGLDREAVDLGLRRSSERYAIRQLTRMRRVAYLLPPAFGELHGIRTAPGGRWTTEYTPREDYREASAAFAALARAAGTVDPRLYLRALLRRASRARTPPRGRTPPPDGSSGARGTW